MTKAFVSAVTTIINTPASKVWDALTDPKMIKQYLLGTDVVTDWKAGSPIIYKGEWQGRSYEDKGEILQVEPGKLLVSTFWSSLAGLADIPENYKTIRYDLVAEGSGTRLTLTQDNNVTEEDAKHSDEFWGTLLETMKKLIEA